MFYPPIHLGMLQWTYTNDRVIDHYNDIRDDNRLSNLQLLITQQENCLRSAKKRGYSFAVKNNQNRKCLKAIDLVTNEIVYYNSLYSLQQHINVNCGIVKMVCEGINNCKSGISKINGHHYSFEYVRPEDMPVDYKKSSDIRPRKYTIDEKKQMQNLWYKEWTKKVYNCPRCGKSIKNGGKYLHNKKCQ